MKRRSERIVRITFLVALVLACWPLLRVLSLGSEPTLEELQQLLCGTR